MCIEGESKNKKYTYIYTANFQSQCLVELFLERCFYNPMKNSRLKIFGRSFSFLIVLEYSLSSFLFILNNVLGTVLIHTSSYKTYFLNIYEPVKFCVLGGSLYSLLTLYLTPLKLRYYFTSNKPLFTNFHNLKNDILCHTYL